MGGAAARLRVVMLLHEHCSPALLHAGEGMSASASLPRQSSPIASAGRPKQRRTDVRARKRLPSADGTT
eukprot:scaffold240857_cov30-Tisochrysis_lutea.AAC.6